MLPPLIEENPISLFFLSSLFCCLSKLKNERDSLSIIYAGKKKFFATFLSEDRRIKLKKIIEKYNSMSK
jgi:hypothetical protein